MICHEPPVCRTVYCVIDGRVLHYGFIVRHVVTIRSTQSSHYGIFTSRVTIIRNRMLEQLLVCVYIALLLLLVPC